MASTDILLVLVLLISLFTDLKYRKILNIITLPAILLAFIIHTWNSGWVGLAFSLQGFILGLVIFLLPFLKGGLGAGDVKLLGAVGALKGPQFVFQAFLLTAILGGIIALLLLIYRRKLTLTLQRLGEGLKILILSHFTIWNFGSLQEPSGDTFSFPYALAIALGSISTYWVM